MNLGLQVMLAQISVWNVLQPAEIAGQIKIKCKIVRWICDFQVLLQFSITCGILICTKTTEQPPNEKLALCFCLCLHENVWDFHLGSDNSNFENLYHLWVRWEPFFMLCLITLQSTNSSTLVYFWRFQLWKIGTGEPTYCMRKKNAKLEIALPILVLIKISSLELQGGVKFTSKG